MAVATGLDGQPDIVLSGSLLIPYSLFSFFSFCFAFLHLLSAHHTLFYPLTLLPSFSFTLSPSYPPTLSPSYPPTFYTHTVPPSPSTHTLPPSLYPPTFYTLHSTHTTGGSDNSAIMVNSESGAILSKLVGKRCRSQSLSLFLLFCSILF